MADKMTPSENLAKAAELLAPIRDRSLSDTDRALVHLADAVSDLVAAQSPAQPAQPA